ncbi:MAG: hypothetical protein LUE99_15015 [Bacteroides sp.]|nr:hypothetical protein [Bacteroides sp.]
MYDAASGTYSLGSRTDEGNSESQVGFTFFWDTLPGETAKTTPTYAYETDPCSKLAPHGTWATVNLLSDFWTYSSQMTITYGDHGASFQWTDKKDEGEADLYFPYGTYMIRGGYSMALEVKKNVAPTKVDASANTTQRFIRCVKK